MQDAVFFCEDTKLLPNERKDQFFLSTPPPAFLPPSFHKLALSLSHTSFETIFHKRTAVVLSCTYRVIVTAQKSFQPSQTLLEQV